MKEDNKIAKVDNEEMDTEKLETIKKEIKKNKKSSKLSDKKKAAIKRAIVNIVLAIFFIFYYDLILKGKNELSAIKYLTDLKTFIIFQLIIAIVLFEMAFKSSAKTLAFSGIELIVNAGMTLIIYNLYSAQNEYINIYVSGFIGFLSIYYFIKSIGIVKRSAR